MKTTRPRDARIGIATADQRLPSQLTMLKNSKRCVPTKQKTKTGSKTIIPIIAVIDSLSLRRGKCCRQMSLVSLASLKTGLTVSKMRSLFKF